MGGGGFLAIGYCSRTKGYCFPIVSGNFCGKDKVLMGGGGAQSRDRGIPHHGKPCPSVSIRINGEKLASIHRIRSEFK